MSRLDTIIENCANKCLHSAVALTETGNRSTMVVPNYHTGGRSMQPKTTDETTAMGANAPEETEVMRQYQELSEEHKKLVTLYVQTLLEAQCTP